MTPPDDIPVLIVGGGPVGLTMSILLSYHGVRSLLVERHPTTATHPKSRAINARTMEVYRQCGVEEAVRAAGLPPERARLIVWARSLAGEEIERRVPWRATAAGSAVSPARNCLCAQDDLEPVLRRCAEGLGPGALRFGAALDGFTQDPDGVTATIVEGGGPARTVRARYLVAADGAASAVRRALGIPMVGEADVYESVNVLLRADLTSWTRERPAALYFVEQPGLTATFLTINGADRWGFLVNSLSASGWVPSDFTPERCVALIRAAAGVPDLPVEILGIAPWTAAARVAARYQAGRVFLAGDAAHEMPPTGGFGLNTGVQDAHNLGWKLAAVLHGWGGPALLSTYDAERRPVGQAITEQSLANSISMGRRGPRPAGGALARPEYLNEQGLIFGASYASAAVIPDGTPPPAVANPLTDYVPSGRPGGRAPHVWLSRGPARASTLDRFGRGFVLLAGADGEPWRHAARDAAAGLRMPLDAVTIGPGEDLDDPEGRWPSTYGVGGEGAVLVRPDGHVAWRHPGRAADPGAALRDGLARLAGRAPEAAGAGAPRPAATHR